MAKKKATPTKKATKNGSKTSAGVVPEQVFSTVEAIQAQASNLQNEVRRFIDEEVKASGRRARKLAMELKKAASDLRKQIQEVTNQRRGA